MGKIDDLKINIYADGADLESIEKYNKDPLIKGFTTNPSLMKSAGIKDYKKFAKKILSIVKHKPVSFEVFADEISEMETQAIEISNWGKNVNVKIPITNSKGVSCDSLIRKLNNMNIICNVTAIFTLKQIQVLIMKLEGKTDIILSIFAGRIADTGIDPTNLMKEVKKICKYKSNIKILWASTREIINIFQAEECKTDIITVPHDLLKKIIYIDKDLNDFSLDTIKQFLIDSSDLNLKI
jgi:transaldolase